MIFIEQSIVENTGKGFCIYIDILISGKAEAITLGSISAIMVKPEFEELLHYITNTTTKMKNVYDVTVSLLFNTFKNSIDQHEYIERWNSKMALMILHILNTFTMRHNLHFSSTGKIPEN